MTSLRPGSSTEKRHSGAAERPVFLEPVERHGGRVSMQSSPHAAGRGALPGGMVTTDTRSRGKSICMQWRARLSSVIGQ